MDRRRLLTGVVACGAVGVAPLAAAGSSDLPHPFAKAIAHGELDPQLFARFDKGDSVFRLWSSSCMIEYRPADEPGHWSVVVWRADE